MSTGTIFDTPTNKPWRRRVGLYLLFGVLLNDVPELPYKLWMEDVEWLGWILPAMLYVGSEQIVVWLLIPLGGKKVRFFLIALNMFWTLHVQQHKLASFVFCRTEAKVAKQPALVDASARKAFLTLGCFLSSYRDPISNWLLWDEPRPFFPHRSKWKKRFRELWHDIWAWGWIFLRRRRSRWRRQQQRVTQPMAACVGSRQPLASVAKGLQQMKAYFLLCSLLSSELPVPKAIRSTCLLELQQQPK